VGKVVIDESWAIAVPENCSIVVETAVADLQRYLQAEKKTKVNIRRRKRLKPSGKTIAVCTNGSGAVTITGLSGYDCFRLEVGADQILVCGSDDRGTIDGVHYLERLLGFSEDAGVEEVQTRRKPVFKYRFANCGDGSEERLAYLSRSGVNHMHMLGTSCWDMCYMESLTPSDTFPWDGQWVKWDKERIAKINEVFDKAQKYGMECWLYVRGTQPFRQGYANYNTRMYFFNATGWLIPGVEIFEKYPDVRGSNRGMDALPSTSRSRWDTPPCWSSENYQRFVRETCQNLFRSIPNLKGIIIVPCDYTLWCDDTCDACRGKSLGTRIADYVTQLRDAAKSVRKDAQVILWTFAFPTFDRSDRARLLSSVPKDVIIVQSYTDGRKIEFDGDFLEYGYVYDWSTVPIPGEVFKEDAEVCRRNGLEFLNYQGLGGGMEVSGSPVPYNDIQIMSDVKELGGAGIFSEGSPGIDLADEMYYWTAWEEKPEIYEVPRKIAERDFGQKASLKMLDAWKQISYAASRIPACTQSIGQFIMQTIIYLSLYPVADAKDFIPLRADQPYVVHSHLQRVLNVGPDYLEKLTKFFERAAVEMEKGIQMLCGAGELTYAEKRRKQVEAWVERLTSHTCRLWSMVHYLQFVKVLRDKTPWQREQMMELMRKEIENTERQKSAAEKMAKMVQEGYIEIVYSRDIDTRELEKKIVEMELDLSKLEKGPYSRPYAGLARIE